MRVQSNVARRFLERIYNTREEELDCGGLMEVIDRYVELEASGEDGSQLAPDVPQHLAVCADCAELVATLKQLVALEDSGELPPIDRLWGELEAAAAKRPQPELSRPDPGAQATGGSLSEELRQRFGRPRLVLLGPVSVGLVIALSVGGWWRATSRAQAATSLVDELGEMGTVRTVWMADGGTVRFFYDLERHELLLHSCDLEPRQALRLHCQHGDDEPETVRATAVHAKGEAHAWWRIECDHPIGAYDSVTVDQGTQGPVVLRIAEEPGLDR